MENKQFQPIYAEFQPLYKKQSRSGNKRTQNLLTGEQAFAFITQ